MQAGSTALVAANLIQTATAKICRESWTKFHRSVSGKSKLERKWIIGGLVLQKMVFRALSSMIQAEAAAFFAYKTMICAYICIPLILPNCNPVTKVKNKENKRKLSC